MSFGKIKEVDLRKGWPKEDKDFTNWLAKQENIAELSSEIGIAISVIDTEANVGSFKVDILAEEENTEKKIVIENQLEPTNHTHLGQIVTYASGLDANIVIWIVKEAREEHKQAIDWLNENTTQDLNFFLIKMELWQIDASSYAPKFNIIVQPNDWLKIVKREASSSRLTETKLLQQDFWKYLTAYASKQGSKLNFHKPSPQHWTNVSIGSSEAHISLRVNTPKKEIGCEIYISDSQDLYNDLFKKKKSIEKEFGKKLIWDPLPGRKASYVGTKKTSVDIKDEENWEKAAKWFVQNTEDLKRIFSKVI